MKLTLMYLSCRKCQVAGALILKQVDEVLGKQKPCLSVMEWTRPQTGNKTLQRPFNANVSANIVRLLDRPHTNWPTPVGKKRWSNLSKCDKNVWKITMEQLWNNIGGLKWHRKNVGNIGKTLFRKDKKNRQPPWNRVCYMGRQLLLWWCQCFYKWLLGGKESLLDNI